MQETGWGQFSCQSGGVRLLVACASARKFITATLRGTRCIALVMAEVHFKSTKGALSASQSYNSHNLREKKCYIAYLWRCLHFSRWIWASPDKVGKVLLNFSPSITICRCCKFWFLPRLRLTDSDKGTFEVIINEGWPKSWWLHVVQSFCIIWSKTSNIYEAKDSSSQNLKRIKMTFCVYSCTEPSGQIGFQNLWRPT